MDIVQRPECHVVGVEVVTGSFAELRDAVPPAWRTVFARHRDLPPAPGGLFADVSTELDGGGYREVLGVLTESAAAPPDGMRVVALPAGTFLRHTFSGPVEAVADAYGAMYAWATEHAVRLGRWKIDTGYRPGFPAGPHELLMDIAG